MELDKRKNEYYAACKKLSVGLSASKKVITRCYN
jgi:DnaJ-domain-containing protein 1